MDNKPIPHLYSAGELGSYYVDLYQGAGNMSECIFAGNTAGKNAAKAKNDTPALEINNTILSDLDETVGEIELKENEYLGVGRGIGGDVTVKVTMDGDKISSVEIVSHNETDIISDKAISDLPIVIIEKQSTEVDTVSGATVTSKAIIEAVNNALEQAKK